jgi:hypothetical protein
VVRAERPGGVARPRPNRSASYLRRGESPLERVLPVLRAADVFVPANITEGLDCALALKRERVDDDAASDGRQLEAALAAGEMTAAEFERKTSKPTKPAVPATERRASLQRAAADAYFEAHPALAAIGDELIAGPLATTCDELLDDPDAPGADDRWRVMWAAVDALRGHGFASWVVMAPRTAEAYRYPHRARAWALAEARRADQERWRIENSRQWLTEPCSRCCIA